MSTLKEIAKRANVSPATVSKVLNGRNGASRETMEAIFAIAKELNYAPNLHARNLKTGVSNTIGVITEDFTVFNTPDIVDGIDEYCSSRGYTYILGNLRHDRLFGRNQYAAPECAERFEQMRANMLARQVAGIIHVGCHRHTLPAAYVQGDVPMVCAYCTSEDPAVPAVLYDDRAAAYSATKLLLEKGHTRIGMIAGPLSSDHASRRLLGYQEALYDHSVPYDPHLVAGGDWQRDSGYVLCGELINRWATAIFAHNDDMALGVLDYCGELGLAVGEDMAVIGFDNREICTVCRPQLSSVALPLYEIGATAAQVLIDLLEGEEDPDPEQPEQEQPEEPTTPRLLLECTLVERDSTG